MLQHISYKISYINKFVVGYYLSFIECSNEIIWSHIFFFVKDFYFYGNDCDGFLLISDFFSSFILVNSGKNLPKQLTQLF